MSRPLTVTLDDDDWVEVVTALETKARRIRSGDLGPEEKPGEDARWVAHLNEVRQKIERVLYAKF